MGILNLHTIDETRKGSMVTPVSLEWPLCIPHCTVCSVFPGPGACIRGHTLNPECPKRTDHPEDERRVHGRERTTAWDRERDGQGDAFGETVRARNPWLPAGCGHLRLQLEAMGFQGLDTMTGGRGGGTEWEF